jgi:hypothetical protein
MAGIVLSVTAYEAFGRLQVLITEHRVGAERKSYRLVANEDIELLETDTGELADALSQLGVVIWRAAERVASSPF